jgi:HAD superfamily hydrolase (TIGR01509 family)
MAKLFELMGIPLPALQEQYKVAQEADEWISCRLKSAFPGAIETVHSLKEQGYLLYTASGGASWQIRGFLTGMGIVDCFEELYGADLVNTMKSNPLFYKRIFEQTGIQANRAIIVDDHLANIERATVVGATAVLVSPSGKTRNENGILSIPRLDGLPQLLSEVLQE